MRVINLINAHNAGNVCLSEIVEYGQVYSRLEWIRLLRAVGHSLEESYNAIKVAGMMGATFAHGANNQVTHTCRKCEGHGYIKAFAHNQAGVCFACKGKGKFTRNAHDKDYFNRKITKAKENAAKVKSHGRKFQNHVDVAMTDDRVWSSPRMNVSKDHPYAEHHALEVYNYHETHGWHNE